MAERSFIKWNKKLTLRLLEYIEANHDGVRPLVIRLMKVDDYPRKLLVQYLAMMGDRDLIFYDRGEFALSGAAGRMYEPHILGITLAGYDFLDYSRKSLLAKVGIWIWTEWVSKAIAFGFGNLTGGLLTYFVFEFLK